MDLTSWFNRLLLVVFIMCSQDSTQLFGVDSQSVNLKILSPGGVIVEGVEVKLQCDVGRLAASHVIEWVRINMNEGVLIATNGKSLDQRYKLETSPVTSTPGISIQQVLTIKNISKTDTSFTCRINDSGSEMTSGSLPSSNNFVYVNYFPSPIYPICFPNGSFTVQEGTEQTLSCTSEKGNPTVSVEFLPTPPTAIFVWMYSESNNEVKGSINLTMNETFNGYQFQCKIASSYFTERDRSCIIGPITVTNMNTDSTEDETTISATEMGSRTDNPNDMMTDGLSLKPSTDIPNCPTQNLGETESSSTQTTNDPLTTDIGKSIQTKTSTSDDMKTTINPSILPIAIIAGAAGGGGFLLLIVITLIVLYACRCCCFNDKSRRSSLWLTDLPLAETAEDPNIDHDIDRSEPKMSTSAYQNVTDLMLENKPDPRMQQQSEPESSHLDTQEMNDDEAADFISPRKFSTHSQNNDQDSHRSPGISSFKLTKSDDRTTDKEDGEHLETVEPNEGDVPMYGVVKKSSRVSQGSKKKQPEITSDGSDPWANASLSQHENINPTSMENDYAEMSPLSVDPGHSRKPTALVKPVSHTPKPPITTKPVTEHQASRRTNTNQAPPSVAKKPIKKFKAKGRNPSADEFGNRDKTPLPTPVAPSVTPHPPPLSLPLTDHEEIAAVEGGGNEVPPDTQEPHESNATHDHDVMYSLNVKE